MHKPVIAKPLIAGHFQTEENKSVNCLKYEIENESLKPAAVHSTIVDLNIAFDFNGLVMHVKLVDAQRWNRYNQQPLPSTRVGLPAWWPMQNVH